MSLPDDDLEDTDEGYALDEDGEDDHAARVWNLLLLINPGDQDSALQQFDAWREAMGGNLDGEGDGWLWTLKDAIDWRSGFYVDGKDAESLIAVIDELAARWNLRIDWGGDVDDEEFLAAHDLPSLMAVAHDRLREDGYTLWNWNTDDDAHAGWIARVRDDEGMMQLAALLQVDMRPGSDAF